VRQKMQINRLFEIVYILLDKKRITSDELAKRFEVSKRTILRDINTLSAAGIPIYTMQGKGGGISILDSYVLNKTVITNEEQEQILIALQSLSATGNIDTENVLSRLRSLFEKQDTDWIGVDFSRWGNTGTDTVKFEALKKAIMNKRAVSFSYSGSYGETTTRKAYPLKLIFKSKSWYLQTFCVLKSDYRTFKINRMRDVIILDDTFDCNSFQFPKDEHVSYDFQSLVYIKLHFAPQATHRVYDDFDEQFIAENEDGSYTVSMSLPREWACDYILSFGVFVEVLEPEEIRKEILQKLQTIKNIYAKT
jgi:predicted DNA-binding transcriptional regulator YafY